ncbi:MAG: ABC transporter ATP-binding protein [Actinomycetota bacterium]|nr:ABC transporter ATP-binding protein [Actinomycetota bacterium]
MRSPDAEWSRGLEVSNLTVRYGETLALDAVDLRVPGGWIVAVVGPSGCGKSSLLRAVAGIERPTSGSVVLAGRALDALPTHRRGVGLMFQDHALFPHLTVGQNVRFGLRYAGVGDRLQENRVRELLALVGLEDTVDRAIDELSGGEAQRVALARSLAPSPRLLMLDEPLGSLDRTLREHLVSVLGRVIRQQGMTAVHVTHDQAEAFALADEVVVLREGRVQQVGTPEDLWRRPASAFVADFLGHPNLWTRGEQTLLVPVDGLRPAVGGAPGAAGGRVRTGRVERSIFREGRYRIEATSTDEHPGESLVFDSAVALVIGAAVDLVVDEAQLRTMPADRPKDATQTS